MSDEKDNVIRVQFGAKPVAEPEAKLEEEGSEPSEGNLEKLKVFTDLVDRGTVLVTLDARREGVWVPGQFSDEMRLNLNFCHGFGIPDFDYDGRGVRASLSFGGHDIFCDIPWEAVYMMRSHVENEVMLFPLDIPPEMLAMMQAAADESE